MTDTYLIFERVDEGTKVIAKLDGETFSGEQAESIEKLLRQKGWPDIPPDQILHGSRCWAALVLPPKENE